ncbi:MAG TPA: hypothetical protein VF194_06350 [Ferrovibrio sp.]|uniref:hypothetical protein n=1 Tax=Ferrovibrio sp. TaxID=1917215 RepID=UPI002ED311D6
MTEAVIPFPDVEELHDRFILASRAFRAAPSMARAAECAEAYARFYRAFNRSSAGLEEAMFELWARMNETMNQARTG